MEIELLNRGILSLIAEKSRLNILQRKQFSSCVFFFLWFVTKIQPLRIIFTIMLVSLSLQSTDKRLQIQLSESVFAENSMLAKSRAKSEGKRERKTSDAHGSHWSPLEIVIVGKRLSETLPCFTSI